MALWKDWFGGRKTGQETPERLHASIMEQSLDPKFFGVGLVRDTFGGRFEVVAMHAVIVLRRLREAGPLGSQLAQDVFDELFSGFDDALREVGTGDLRVGKKIKDIASAFYGRAEAYDAALNKRASDEEAAGQELCDAISRNAELPEETAERFAAFVLKLDDALKSQSDDALMKGRIEWPQTF